MKFKPFISVSLYFVSILAESLFLLETKSDRRSISENSTVDLFFNVLDFPNVLLSGSGLSGGFVAEELQLSLNFEIIGAPLQKISQAAKNGCRIHFCGPIPLRQCHVFPTEFPVNAASNATNFGKLISRIVLNNPGGYSVAIHIETDRSRTLSISLPLTVRILPLKPDSLHISLAGTQALESDRRFVVELKSGSFFSPTEKNSVIFAQLFRYFRRKAYTSSAVALVQKSTVDEVVTSFSLAQPGECFTDVTVYASDLNSSIFLSEKSLTITKGAAKHDSAQSFLSAILPFSVVATDSASPILKVHLLDSLGNPATLPDARKLIVGATAYKDGINGPNLGDLNTRISNDSGTGMLIVSVEAGVKTGSFFVSVILGGSHLTGSPSLWRVVSAETSPLHSVVSGPGIAGSLPNITTSFVVQARDMYGNQRESGGDDVVAGFFKPKFLPAFNGNMSWLPFRSEIDVTVTDNLDGSYTAVYNSKASGDFLLNIAINGGLVGSIGGIPVSVRAGSNVVHSYVVRRQKFAIVAGEQQWFQVFPLNNDGRKASANSLPRPLLSLLSERDSVTVNVQSANFPEGSGWNASFVAFYSGLYTLYSTDGKELIFEDFSGPGFPVLPSKISAKLSRVVSRLSSPVGVNESVSVTFDARDQFGNVITDSLTQIRERVRVFAKPGISCFSENEESASVYANPVFVQGFLCFQFSFLVAGGYQVFGAVNQEELERGSCVTINVLSGEFDPSLTQIRGFSKLTSIAGLSRPIQIDLFDSYQNPVSLKELKSCFGLLSKRTTVGEILPVSHALFTGNCSLSSDCFVPFFAGVTREFCHLLVNVTSKSAGNFSLQVFLDGSPLFLFPHSIEIFPEQPSALFSAIMPLNQDVVSGRFPEVSLAARDLYGNSVPYFKSSNLDFLTNSTQPTLVSTNRLKNGAILSTAGAVKLQPFLGSEGLQIEANDVIRVTQANSAAGLSYAFGSGILYSFSGEPSKFFVQMVSENGELQSESLNCSLEVHFSPNLTLEYPPQLIQIAYIGDGVYQINYKTFELPRLGSYEISVFLASNSHAPGSHISGSPFVVPIFRGKPSVQNLALSGVNGSVSSTQYSAAGSPLYFYIEPKNATENSGPVFWYSSIPVMFESVAAKNESYSPISVIQDFNNGSYRAIFLSEKAGTYFIFFKVNGGLITGNFPVRVVLEPAANKGPALLDSLPNFDVADPFLTPFQWQNPLYLSPERCAVSGRGINATKVQARVLADFLIYSNDQNGNLLGYGGIPWRVQVSSADENPANDMIIPNIQDLGNGVFRVEYLPNDAGSLRIEVAIFGKNLTGSPFAMEAVPGPVSAENSFSFGSGFVSAIAYTPAPLFVQSVDVNGVKRTGHSDLFEFQAYSDSGFFTSGFFSASDTKGLYSAEYVAEKSGVIKVETLFQGATVSSFSVEVFSLPADSNKSRVLNPSSQRYLAGKPIKVFVIAMDSFGNPSNFSLPTVWLTEVPSGRPMFPQVVKIGRLNSSLVADGLYEAIFLPFLSGNYSVFVKLNNSRVQNGNISITVVPERAATVKNSTFPALMVNKLGNFSLRVEDRFGNPIFEGRDFISSTLACFVSFTDEFTGQLVQRRQQILAIHERLTGEYDVEILASYPGVVVAEFAIEASYFLYEGIVRLSVASVHSVGVVDPKKTSFFGAGILRGSVIGKPAYFGICLRDVYGFPVSAAASANVNIKVNLERENSVPFIKSSTVHVEGCFYHIAYSAFTENTTATAIQANLSVVINGGMSRELISLLPGDKEYPDTSIIVLDKFGREFSSPMYLRLDETSKAVFGVQGLTQEGMTVPISVRDVEIVIKSGVATPGKERAVVWLEEAVNGVLIGSLKATTAGKYVVAYRRRGTIVSKSFSVVFCAGVPVRAEFVGITQNFVAGNPGNLFFNLFDKSGSKISPTEIVSDSIRVLLVGPSQSQGPSQGSVLLSQSREFLASFLETKAGNCTFSVLVNGFVLKTIQVLIQPGAFLAANSIMSVSESSLVRAGDQIVFEIFPYDQFGNPITSQTIVFDISMVLSNGRNVSRGKLAQTGQFPVQLSLVFTELGIHSVHFVELKSFSEPKNSPWQIEVLPSKLSASTTVIQAAIGGKAGQLSYFLLFPRDRYSNAVEAELGVNFSAKVVSNGVNSVEVMVQNVSDLPFAIAETAAAPIVPPGAVLLAYKTSVPGNFSLIITVDEVHVANSPLDVTLLPEDPPILNSAYFDHTGSKIILTFSEETNYGIAFSEATTCDLFLAKQTLILLGESPLCIWRNSRTMAVLLGFEARIFPVNLLPTPDPSPSLIKINSVLTSKSGGNASTISRIVVQTWENSAQSARKSAALWTIPSAGICDDIVLDASGTLRVLGRYPTFIFRVFSSVSTSALEHFLSLHNPSRPFITVPRSFLLSGFSYRFSVVTLDATGKLSEASILVRTFPRPIPRVAIRVPARAGGSRHVFTASGQQLTLSAEFYLPNNDCWPGTQWNETSFAIEWLQLSGPAVNLSFDSGWSGAKLILPPFSLRFGESYNFQVVVKSKANPAMSSSDSVTVLVLADDISVELSGSNRTVSATEDLTLEVIVKDPLDLLPGGNHFSSQILWECEVVSAQIGRNPCFSTQNFILNKGEKSVTIPKYTLAEGLYIFTVKVSKLPISLFGIPLKGRMAIQSSILVSVLERTVPNVSLSLSIHGVQNASMSNLDYSSLLFITCHTPSQLYNYKWVFEEDGMDTDLKVQNKALGLETSWFNSSRDYNYRCDVYTNPTNQNPVSSASFTIPGAEPLWGGALVVQSTTGDCTGHLYTISAGGFYETEENLPLSFVFGYKAKAGAVTYLTKASSFFRSEVFLPIGEVVVVAVIISGKGVASYIELNGPVVVNNSTGSGEILKDYFSQFLEIGDQEKALQIAQILISSDLASVNVSFVLESVLGVLQQDTSPTKELTEVAVCLVEDIISNVDSFSLALFEPSFNFATKYLSFVSGSNPAFGLSLRATQCYLDLVSKLVEYASLSTEVNAINKSLLMRAVSQIGEGFLTGLTTNLEKVAVFNSTKIDLFAALVYRESIPYDEFVDFPVALGSYFVKVNILDGQVPFGSVFYAIAFCLKGVDPLSDNKRVFGDICSLAILFQNSAINSLQFVTSNQTQANTTTSIRSWNGTSWISTNVASSSKTGTVSAILAANDASYFCAFLEKVDLPHLSLSNLSVTTMDKMKWSLPPLTTVLLSTILPPVLLLLMAVLGLITNRVWIPSAVSASVDSSLGILDG